MTRSTITGMWGGKKHRMVHKKSRRVGSLPVTTRQLAHLERTRYDFRKTPRLGVAKRRRKGGPRRKVTLIQSIFKWVWAPTGKVRKTTRRRR